MAGFLTALAKSIGPKLVIGAGLGAVGLFVAGKIEGPARTDGKAAEFAASEGTVAHPADNIVQPEERSRSQPMEIDPHALVVKRVLKIDKPFRHGDYVWDESGAPATGPIIITIDLKAQTLSVFRAGYEIGAAVILYGADDKPSPLGAFPITEKDADHVSNLYDAPMPYMLRLTNDGVAIHGSDVKWGNATHGCIGIPVPFAEKLFGVTKPGDLAIITNGKMLDTTHADPT